MACSSFRQAAREERICGQSHRFGDIITVLPHGWVHGRKVQMARMFVERGFATAMTKASFLIMVTPPTALLVDFLFCMYNIIRMISY